MGYYHIKDLLLPDKLLEDYIFDTEEKRHDRSLTNLSKINIFVGPNNSGKSRLLRSLAAHITPYKYVPPTYVEGFQEIVRLINEYRIKFESINADFLDKNISWGQFPIHKLPPRAEDILSSPRSFLNDFYDHAQEVKEYINGLDEIKKVEISRLQLYRMEPLLNDYLPQIEKIYPDYNKKVEFKSIYIPTLRGFRPLYPIANMSNTDCYANTTQAHYFNTEGEQIRNKMEIFTGYLLYEQLQELLLGDHEQRRQVKEFERFLSKNFFQSQDVVLIPKLQPNNKEAKDVFVKVGKEAERPIHQLGDGLQQIILITFPVFRDKKKDLLVFVEEPELFMHPGMQRALLEVFASSEFGHSQFFINTHSNHLLDLSLDIEDIAIYHLRKDRTEETDESIKNIYRVKQLNEEDRSLLNDLGVRNSSVFLTNATIWVEGITDRKYIRKYLALYQNHKLSLDSSFKLIKEDTHYSFVEYGGANITHWSFLSENEEEEAINIDKLCSSAFVVMDRDSGTYKQVRATKIEKKLGKNFHLTKGKEIENAISSNIIVKVVSNWEKIQPGAVNNNFETDDYRESGLGAFIEDVILKDAAKKKRKYVKRKEDGSIDGSGTILPKGKFCDAATEETKQFSDLSNESVELCEKLYNFVQSMNK